MTLIDAIAAAGMTPPHKLVEGRWLRFPGIGKGRSNRAGWCRLIAPTLAIYGDWSSNFSATWRDESHRDDARTAKLLEEARRRERAFAVEQLARQAVAAEKAVNLIRESVTQSHWYLTAKGFPDQRGLVHDGKLIIPVRDVANYNHVISVQQIIEHAEKRFLPGGRTRGGIHRLGPAGASRIVLCEGYATGLSIEMALQRLAGSHAVIVCFSAHNLELVAERFPQAVVATDNDHSMTGEICAKRTGLRWIMPPDVDTDFNDQHQQYGLQSVVNALRGVFATQG